MNDKLGACTAAAPITTAAAADPAAAAAAYNAAAAPHAAPQLGHLSNAPSAPMVSLSIQRSRFAAVFLVVVAAVK